MNTRINMSSLDRNRVITGSTVLHEVGTCGGTSSMAAVRASQMAKQRELNAVSSRKMRSEEYLRNLQDEEEREKLDAKGRARARESKLEEERMDRLAARADRLRLRTEGDPLPTLTEKKIDAAAGQSSETPYSILKARRRHEQLRRQSSELREQVSSDLARARALLREERTRDDLQLSRDISRNYETSRVRPSYREDTSNLNHWRENYETSRASRPSYREDTANLNHWRETPAPNLRTRVQRRLDFDNDWSSPSRNSTGEDKLPSETAYSRANGAHKDTNNSLQKAGALKNSTDAASRTSKEVHWSLDE